MRRLLNIVGAVLCALCAPQLSHACPLVSGLPDFNCDGKIVISIIGDSLVYGTNDSENHGKGGYVLRAQEKLPGVKFYDLGYPGVTTNALISKVDRAFSKGGDSHIAHALVKSDLIVIDVGRNDEWGHAYTQTAASLKKLRSQIEHEVGAVTEHKPLVVTSVLMITRTIKMGEWIKQLNRYIMASNSKSAPADLRFDAVPWQLCGVDRIHPTPRGYERLGRILVSYITHTYPKHVAALRKDRDHDGLYDIFERSKYGTNPHKRDTDKDGLRDGSDPYPLKP